MGPLNCFFEVLTKRDLKVLQEKFTTKRGVTDRNIPGVLTLKKVSHFDVAFTVKRQMWAAKRSPRPVCRERWAALPQSSSSWSSAPPAASPPWPEGGAKVRFKVWCHSQLLRGHVVSEECVTHLNTARLYHLGWSSLSLGHFEVLWLSHQNKRQHKTKSDSVLQLKGFAC